MGQVGPRTVLKCSMRGMRLVRNRVSMMTAALELFVVLISDARTMLSCGLDFRLPCVLATCVGVADAESERGIDGVLRGV